VRVSWTRRIFSLGGAGSRVRNTSLRQLTQLRHDSNAHHAALAWKTADGAPVHGTSTGCTSACAAMPIRHGHGRSWRPAVGPSQVPKSFIGL
jgi:hypothetical protein